MSTRKYLFERAVLYWVLTFSALSLVAQPHTSEDLVLTYENGKYGYYSKKTGVTVIKPQYTLAKGFAEGLAAINYDGSENGWGYIDATGKVVISPKFRQATSFSEGLAGVELQSDQGFVYARTGNRMRSLWGYVDRSGEFIIPPQFIHAFPFVNGVARLWTGSFVSQNKYGVIDKSGKEIVTPIFDNIASDFYEGLAPFRMGEKWGFIDVNGKTIIEPKFNGAGRFSDGLAGVAIKNKYNVPVWGFVNRNGEIVIEPQFSMVGHFSEGLARFASFKGKYGYVDKTGNTVIKAQFDGANDFVDGSAEVIISTNKKCTDDMHGTEQTRVKIGLIDRSGRFIEKPTYSTSCP